MKAWRMRSEGDRPIAPSARSSRSAREGQRDVNGMRYQRDAQSEEHPIGWDETAALPIRIGYP